MQPGSIVARVRDVPLMERLELAKRGIPIPGKNLPYIILEGPFEVLWDDGKMAAVIILEEIPGIEYNSYHFEELQPPMPMEEIVQIANKEPELIPA